MYPSNLLRFRSLAQLLVFVAALSSTHAQNPLVIIDPGHGGTDAGAHHGVSEKTLNLQLALALEQRLHDLNIDTALTRDRDVFISLPDRARYAEKFTGPKLFVSLHYNGHGRKAANGIETFYHTPKSRSLAVRIQNALIRKTQATDRKVKKGNFAVIRKNKAPVSVLVEGGFLSNDAERDRIAHPSYRELQAQAIAEAIAGYVGKPLRPVPSRLRYRPVAQLPPGHRPGLQVTAMRPATTRPSFFPRQRWAFQRQR